jgi:murein DD-endopeptidase MepM/ murein hydrolase activator NlpD
MRRLGRLLIFLLLFAALGAGAVYWIAGRGEPPSLVIEKPDRLVGRTGELGVVAGAPGARFTSLSITLEQNGRQLPLYSHGEVESGDAAQVAQVDADRIRITRAIGKPQLPDLQAGPARIVVSATRPSIFDLRPLTASASKDFEVRLDPPRVSIISTHHFVNHGGSEMVVYRVTPPDAWSGVRVGSAEFPGYPAAGAGVAGADPALKIAFFALAHDDDLRTPVAILARDEAGNEASVGFVDRVFPKPFRKSRIALDDRFLQRVVPDILTQAPELGIDARSTDLLPAFLKINGDLRRANAERIIALTKGTDPGRLWEGPFVPMGGSAVEAGFADYRTYVYRGDEVDQQVHLGFDLAATAAAPLVAANTGKVLHAGWLGIYGNCVIIDHGMGVASLYGHLSSVEVGVGDTVKRGQQIGRSGMTGLAGGDHLHFTMLVHGRAVNPVEWWDAHWIADRIDRKLRDAGR